MRVLVECDADEVVLRALGLPRKQLLHFGGKYELVKKLKDRANDVGMVDEDPGKLRPQDMSSYRLMDSAEGLHLLARQGSGGHRPHRKRGRSAHDAGNRVNRRSCADRTCGRRQSGARRTATRHRHLPVRRWRPAPGPAVDVPGPQSRRCG